MKNQRHPDGYLPKIVYHMVQGNKEKVQYFVDRHVSTYGPLTEQDRHTMGEMYFNQTNKA